jgi:hypothetical protein
MGAPPGKGPEDRISHNTSPKHTTRCGDAVFQKAKAMKNNQFNPCPAFTTSYIF